MNVKQALMELTKSLPDDCTWDDVMYRIYVRQKIENAMKEADAGNLIDHEEVFKEFEDEHSLDAGGQG
jgi:predicted transcriptional regulator